MFYAEVLYIKDYRKWIVVMRVTKKQKKEEKKKI